MRYIYVIILSIFICLHSTGQTTLDTAPDFSCKDIHGLMHYLYPTLDSNKFVVLDFFTTTCGPCVTYAPDLQQAYVHFGSNQGDVRFLGINYADDNTGVAYFDSVHGIEFPTVSGLNGHGNTIAVDIFNIQSFPTVLLIAPNRLILNNQIFPPSFQNLDSTLTSSIGIYASTGELQENKEGIMLREAHPNPVVGYTNFSIESSRSDKIGFLLSTVAGEIVYRLDNIAIIRGKNNIPLETSGLKPGIYFASFVAENKVFGVKKLIKQ